MTDQHPITPPPELVQQWTQMTAAEPAVTTHWNHIATQAARWGYQQCMKLDAAWLEAKLQKARDQELEACCKWLEDNWGPDLVVRLRAARRPKPPSLKEQALKLLNDYGVPFYRYTAEQTETIRRALEQLDD